MSLKQLLKSAKAAIERGDAELALECVDDALDYDKNCYFAYIFQGKSYQLLSQPENATKSFEKAIAIEPDNLLGWKGYFQVGKTLDDYHKFFEILTGYVQVLIDQELGIAEVIKEFYNYLNHRKYQTDEDLHEAFLRAILPGTKLGDLLDGSMGKPEDTLKKLITLLKNKEAQEVRLALAKEKLKLPRVLTPALVAQLNQLEWSIRQPYNLSKLYGDFLNYCQDDDLRRQYEVEYLKYKYEILRISPEKRELLNEIKLMCEDMVLIDTDDLFTWTLYFDLLDVKALEDLDQNTVFRFISKFENEGLGLVLMAYAMSDLSVFDRSKLKDLRLKTLTLATSTTDSEELETDVIETDAAASDSLLSPDEVLELMQVGSSKSSNSMLAHRIVCDYFIHLQEYETASAKCIAATRHLADLQRTYGIDLVNCKEDILCLLATVYTYHEAPKNFSRALQLYDRILNENPENKNALIGKGLILLEKRELDEANTMLKHVVSRFPEDWRALSEYGWCQVLSKNYTSGREILSKALSNIQGWNMLEGRASVQWRLAKSYLLEEPVQEGAVKQAYDLLILLLKDSKNHAPSFTLLGIIYNDYYKDTSRAQKCFFKAFELDVAEVTAAKYIVTELAEKNEWEVTDILCKRVVTSEKSRRVLFSTLHEDPDKSWPYRVLGCSALNRQDDAKAIEWFQTALRMQAMDTECWVGLGEAYFNCGRIDATIKVFQHATKVDPESWTNFYFLGLAVCEIGDYVDGLDILKKALQMSPNEECVLNAIYEKCIDYSAQLILGGFIGRTLEINKFAIDKIHDAATIDHTSQSLWKSLGQCLNLASRVRSNIEDFPIDIVLAILDKVPEANSEDFSLEKAQALFSNGEFVEAISMLQVLSAKAAVAVLPKKVSKFLRSLAQFNLGLALLDGFNSGEERHMVYRDHAVAALKRAIQIEGGNALYWIALGNAYASTNAEIAQHCFIKASVLDSRDIQVWINLAALYLRHGDTELAKEAFDRSTSLAPDQSISWLGVALTAEAEDDIKTATRMTTHAYVLSNGRSPLAQLCYASSVVTQRIGNAKNVKDVEAAQEFSIANYAIQSFLKMQPNDITGLKLALLLSERCQTYHMSIEVGERLCQLLEQKYEESESLAVLLEFAQAKTLLARVCLGMEDYAKGIDHAQFTIDVLGEEEYTEEVRNALLSSRIVIGLSFFFNNQFNDALEELKMILSEHSQSHRAVTLIAQVLFAYNTPETKQAAIDQLFSFIEENGSSLMVVLTLGAISVADNLEEYFVPIKEELEGLLLVEVVDDANRLVPQLLAELSDRITGKKDTRVWQKFALLFPQDYNIWRHLSLSMALSTALLSDSKRTAMEVSQAYVNKGTRREVQRALLLCGDLASAREALGVTN